MEESEIPKPSKEFEQAIDNISDVFIKEEEKSYRGTAVPFETHAQKKREEMHDNMMQFRERFFKGYEVLLGELTQQYTGSSNSGLPPGAIRL